MLINYYNQDAVSEKLKPLELVKDLMTKDHGE